MKILTVLIGLTLRFFNFRFSKAHRQNETWQYEYLNTVAINQIASGLKVSEFFKIYN